MQRPRGAIGRAYSWVVSLDVAIQSHDEESELARVAPMPAMAGPGLAPRQAAIIAMQRSAGNAAVSRMLARDPVDAPDAAAASPVADLAQRAGSASGLRGMVTANPGLADQVTAYLATTEDPALERADGRGLPARRGAGRAGARGRPARRGGRPPPVAKNPTDPAVALPAPIPGKKTLDKGDMVWTLKPANTAWPASTSSSSPTRPRSRPRTSASARP